jgi:hypothetical protein
MSQLRTLAVQDLNVSSSASSSSTPCSIKAVFQRCFAGTFESLAGEPLSQHHVTLILGAPGSGKTALGSMMCQVSSESKTERLAVSIRLQDYRDQLLTAVRDGKEFDLLLHHLTTSGQFTLPEFPYDLPMCVMLDGLDELGQKINVYRVARLDRWTRAHLFFACRQGYYVSKLDMHEYAAPVAPLTPWLRWLDRFSVIHLMPLDYPQINAFVSEFARAVGLDEEGKVSLCNMFATVLERPPARCDLVRQPRMLIWALEYLHGTDLAGARARGSVNVDLLAGSTTAPKRQTATEAELASILIDRWIDYELNRRATTSLPGLNSTLPTKQLIYSHAREIAFGLLDHKHQTVDVKSSQPSDSDTEDLSESLFVPMDLIDAGSNRRLAVDLEAGFGYLPVTSPSHGQYAFLSESVRNVLAAQHIAVQLRDLADQVSPSSSISWPQCLIHSSTRTGVYSSLAIAKRLLNDEGYRVVRACAALVPSSADQYIPVPYSSWDEKESKPVTADHGGRSGYVRALWQLMEASRCPDMKSSPDLRRMATIASANAITILNAAGVSFKGRNFSGAMFGGVV